MKYLLYIFIASVIVFLYFGVFGKSEQRRNNERQTEQSVDEVQQKQWEVKIDEQPPVTIKITPLELGKNAKTWKFTAVFDTHSGSLDEDLTQVAVLMDDEGNAYRPLAWEGPGPGGHHRVGVLVFDALNPVPTYIELKIKDVGGVPERLFKWNIQ